MYLGKQFGAGVTQRLVFQLFDALTEAFQDRVAAINTGIQNRINQVSVLLRRRV